MEYKVTCEGCHTETELIEDNSEIIMWDEDSYLISLLCQECGTETQESHQSPLGDDLVHSLIAHGVPHQGVPNAPHGPPAEGVLLANPIPLSEIVLESFQDWAISFAIGLQSEDKLCKFIEGGDYTGRIEDSLPDNIRPHSPHQSE